MKRCQNHTKVQEICKVVKEDLQCLQGVSKDIWPKRGLVGPATYP